MALLPQQRHHQEDLESLLAVDFRSQQTQAIGRRISPMHQLEEELVKEVELEKVLAVEALPPLFEGEEVDSDREETMPT